MMRLLTTFFAVFAFNTTAVAHPAVHLHTHVFSGPSIFLLVVTSFLMAVAGYISERSRSKRAVRPLLIKKSSHKRVKSL